jgi:hypothetical protein
MTDWHRIGFAAASGLTCWQFCDQQPAISTWGIVVRVKLDIVKKCYACKRSNQPESLAAMCDFRPP